MQVYPANLKHEEPVATFSISNERENASRAATRSSIESHFLAAILRAGQKGGTENAIISVNTDRGASALQGNLQSSEGASFVHGRPGIVVGSRVERERGRAPPSTADRAKRQRWLGLNGALGSKYIQYILNKRATCCHVLFVRGDQCLAGTIC